MQFLRSVAMSHIHHNVKAKDLRHFSKSINSHHTIVNVIHIFTCKVIKMVLLEKNSMSGNHPRKSHFSHVLYQQHISINTETVYHLAVLLKKNVPS